MNRLATTALLLTACAGVTLPPPYRCERDALPPGVLAEADVETLTITLGPEWDRAPAAVQVYAVAHEACHLRGQVDEGAADCCAARAVAGLWGRTAVLDAALWLQARGRDVVPIVECLP